MQTSEFPDRGSLIFLLIYYCLTFLLAWNASPSSLNVSCRTSTQEATKTGSVATLENRPDSGKLPMDHHPGGNQFLARTAVENDYQKKLNNVTIKENLTMPPSRNLYQPEHFDGKFRSNQLRLGRSWDELSREHAKNAWDVENGVVTSSNDENIPQNKFVAHLEIERSNSDEKSGVHSTDSEMEIEDWPETGLSSSALENFSAAILQESNKSEAKSNFGSSNEGTIAAETCGSKISVRLLVSDSAEKKEEENRVATLFDDEGHTKMAADGLEKRVSSAQKDTEICSGIEGDYLWQQFGIHPEKGENCTEEKSIMHSSKNATQFRGEENEGEVLGTLPNEESLKNGRETESTISLVRPAVKDHCKEERDLNAIVRRMIMIELEKHCKKEQATLKRAHSVTGSVRLKNINNTKNRAGTLNLQGQSFIRDLLNLEEALRKRTLDKSDTESTEIKFDETIAQGKDGTSDDANCLRDILDSRPMVVDDSQSTDNLGNSTEVTCTAASNIPLERKVNLPCLTAVQAEELIRAESASKSRREKYSKSTQTERIYVIRTARSCPLGKRRLSLHLQLQRLALNRAGVCSKTVYASRDFTEFIYRKASDNLIYEKGKGSHSPSYVSAPERFRWRYLTSNKVT